MSAPENYSATASLRDGRAVEIRALRPDKDDMLMAVSRTGTQSLQRRFFVVRRGFSEREITYFMNVALVTFADEDGQKVVAGADVTLSPNRARRRSPLSGCGLL